MPTVWSPGRMQHGRAEQLIGCLHARAGHAPLRSAPMSSRARAGPARQKRPMPVSSGPGWEEHLASRGPGSAASAGNQTRRKRTRRAWLGWNPATKVRRLHLVFPFFLISLFFVLSNLDLSTQVDKITPEQEIRSARLSLAGCGYLQAASRSFDG
jgi:hypothetical protein